MGATVHGDWVTAIATVLAALIGVAGGYLLARYQREHRKVLFTLLGPEDLAANLRQHGDFEIKWASHTTKELVLSSVSVRNLGNCTIENLEFVVRIPGHREHSQISAVTANAALLSQLSINPAVASGTNPEYTIKLPFFNVDDFFRVNAVYSGDATPCEVMCRLPNAIVDVMTVYELDMLAQKRRRWLDNSVRYFVIAYGAAVMLFVFFLAGLALANHLWPSLFK